MLINFSAAEFLALGLELAGYKDFRLYNENRNIERFKSHFGTSPKSCEDIFKDMQTIGNEESRLRNAKPQHLLLGLRFLWAYPTERDLGRMFQMSEKTVRKWSGIYVFHIHLLLPTKVSK